MARLSVNLNKIALLRNSRHTGVPDMLTFAKLALENGSEGITVHPRPDERHIRRSDVTAIAKWMQPMRPTKELNIEGYPDERFMEIVRDVMPEQCTLVPDLPSAFTSDEGWKGTAEELKVLVPAVLALKALGTRVILFVDSEPSIVEKCKEAGADGIEIYTGEYAAAFKKMEHTVLLEKIKETAEAAEAFGLVVNVGHDLDLENIPPLIKVVPFLAEASIGHVLTADALVEGFPSTVRAYANALKT